MQIWEEEYDPIDESGLDLLIAHKSIDYRPGKYKWSKTKEFQESGLYFKKNGRYCDYIPGSPSFEDFWDAEEYKIKHGMINSDGHYICGRMYSYLNYGIIYDKKKKELVLPDFWDSDAYFWIEETKSELRGLKFGGTKARQRGYSLKGGHRVILQFYHVPNSISYVGSFIEDKAAKFWEMVEANARHLDAHTPWHKNKTPSTKDFWKAQVLITEDTGKKTFKGFMSEFHKVTFKQSPSSGVGGAVDLFIYEEPGLAPTLMQTIKYLEPAMSDGDFVTGMFWSLGSVGELKDCKDLEKIARSPKDYGFAQFPNDFDPKKSNPPCGWFHPASWSYKGFIDAEGNSDVEGATARILEKREKASRQSPKDYILAITQDPLTLDEAFQARDVNKFPVKLISKRLTELEETNFRTTYVDLVSDPKATRTNSITWQLSDDIPVYDFPVKEHSYKKGVIEILEHPDENAEFGTYVAGLDPYKFDESKYSDSIGSIYIYKRTTSLNGNYLDTPVAWYAGRPENLDIFYDNVEKLVKYYNATVLIENDVNDIIRHFLQKNLHKYLAKTPGWIKDVAENTSVNTEYGIRATVKNIEHFENSIIKYIQEEIGTSFSEDGKVVHTKYGVDRIYDVMLLKELLQYSKTGNYDRIRSFGITLAYANGMDRIVGDANNVKDYSEMFNGITRAKGHFTGSKRNMFNMHRR